MTLIRQREPDFSLKNIRLDDAASFALYNRGETLGLFQMESGGMTSVSKQFDVQKIDDIIALIALYRPGPMDLIPEYIKAKKGTTPIRYLHPLLEEVCADTYGIMIYQEQVMAAANKLAGYSLGQSDLLRRAMGKKDREKMAKERVNFIEGCARKNRIGEKKANAIFDLLEKFAGYGFNKSHSAAYGLISYQTAYLKANYPVEFFCGLLSNEINNTDKISIFVGECKRMGIGILPPDINRSGLKFTPEQHEGAMAIRYGLAGIKNVGEGAMEAAIRERERGGDFLSLDDFCARLDSRIANRKMLESLVKAGAFDFLGRDRADLFGCIEDSLASSAAAHRDRAAGQVSLFNDLMQPAQSRRREPIAPWSERERMTYEKELLGFYVTGHPLDAYAALFAVEKYQPISSLSELPDRSVFRIAGAIAQVDRKFTKKEGKPFAVVWLEDLTGTIEVVLWNEVFVKVSDALQVGAVIALKGILDKRDDTVRATAQKAKVLTTENEPKGSAGVTAQAAEMAVRLRFSTGATPDELREVREILTSSPGHQPVQLVFGRPTGEALCLDAGNEFRISLTPELERRLSPWLSSSADAQDEKSFDAIDSIA